MEQNSPSREPSVAAEGRSFRWAAWLLVAGGALAVATLPLGWARVSYPTPGPGYAVDAVGHVRAGVLLGAFMLVAGAVALMARSQEVKRVWLIAGIACGVALGAVAIVDLLTERTRALDALLRHSTVAGQAPPAGLVDYSLRPGIFLSLLAAGLALAAGVVMLRGRTGGPGGGAEPSEAHHDP